MSGIGGREIDTKGEVNSVMAAGGGNHAETPEYDLYTYTGWREELDCKVWVPIWIRPISIKPDRSHQYGPNLKNIMMEHKYEFNRAVKTTGSGYR